jgi:hypothetical protein
MRHAKAATFYLAASTAAIAMCIALMGTSVARPFHDEHAREHPRHAQFSHGHHQHRMYRVKCHRSHHHGHGRHHSKHGHH